MSDEHAFNIGAIAKTVASWGVMKLVENGDLDLDAPALDYLMRWQLPQSKFDHDLVTVRRMSSHTAGLSLSGYPGFQPGEKLPSEEKSLSGAPNGHGSVRFWCSGGTGLRAAPGTNDLDYENQDGRWKPG